MPKLGGTSTPLSILTPGRPLDEGEGGGMKEAETRQAEARPLGPSSNSVSAELYCDLGATPSTFPQSSSS